MKKKYWIIGGIAVLFVIGALNKQGTQTDAPAKATPTKAVAIATPTVKVPQTLDEKIRASLPEKLSSVDIKIEDAVDIDTNASLPGMKMVNFTEKLGEGFWNLNAAKSGVWNLATAIVKNTFPVDKSIYAITLDAELPTTDSYGHKQYDKLEYVIVTRNTFNKIDFSNFNASNIPTVADSYFENHAITEK